MAEVIYFFSLLWYNTHGPIRGLAAYSVYLLFSQQILRFAGIACSYHALRKKISASQLLSSPANMVKYLLETIREKTKGVRMEIILPKVLYHFTAACVDCGVVFGHCLRLRHTASEKGAGHPRLVPCVCLLSVSDFPSDEGTYHSRMRVRPFRRSFFIVFYGRILLDRISLRL